MTILQQAGGAHSGRSVVQGAASPVAAGDGLTIAVAVCTRNRSEMLQRCLASLQACHPPDGASTFVLVIDNSDMPQVREKNRAAIAGAGGPYEIVLVEVPEPGLCNARNRALDEAARRGLNALIFVDDDQTVPPDWLATMVSVWREEGCEAVKSSVRFEFEGEGRYREFFEETGGRDKAALPARWPLKYTATNGVLISSRLFATRKLRFNGRYNLSGGEDFDFFLQSTALGGRHLATSECWISELIPAGKQRWQWLMRRRFQVGFGQSCVVAPHEGKGRGHCLASGVRRLAREAPLALILAPWPRRAFSHLLGAAYGAGQIWGALGLDWGTYGKVVGR